MESLRGFFEVLKKTGNEDLISPLIELQSATKQFKGQHSSVLEKEPFVRFITLVEERGIKSPHLTELKEALDMKQDRQQASAGIVR